MNFSDKTERLWKKSTEKEQLKLISRNEIKGTSHHCYITTDKEHRCLSYRTSDESKFSHEIRKIPKIEENHNQSCCSYDQINSVRNDSEKTVCEFVLSSSHEQNRKGDLIRNANIIHKREQKSLRPHLSSNKKVSDLRFIVHTNKMVNLEKDSMNEKECKTTKPLILINKIEFEYPKGTTKRNYSFGNLHDGIQKRNDNEHKTENDTFEYDDFKLRQNKKEIVIVNKEKTEIEQKIRKFKRFQESRNMINQVKKVENTEKAKKSSSSFNVSENIDTLDEKSLDKMFRKIKEINFARTIKKTQKQEKEIIKQPIEEYNISFARTLYKSKSKFQQKTAETENQIEKNEFEEIFERYQKVENIESRQCEINYYEKIVKKEKENNVFDKIRCQTAQQRNSNFERTSTIDKLKTAENKINNELEIICGWNPSEERNIQQIETEHCISFFEF